VGWFRQTQISLDFWERYGNIHNLQCEAVYEHFTEEELQKFKEYIKRVHDDELTATEFEPYPAEDGIMPYRHIGEGGGDRVIEMKAEKGYDLSFGNANRRVLKRLRRTIYLCLPIPQNYAYSRKDRRAVESACSS